MCRCLAAVATAFAALRSVNCFSASTALHSSRRLLLLGQRPFLPRPTARMAATAEEHEAPRGATPHAAEPLDEVLRLRGPVAAGFGRGSKKVGNAPPGPELLGS